MKNVPLGIGKERKVLQSNTKGAIMKTGTLTKSIFTLAFAAVFAAVTAANADTLIYEGFNYGPAGTDQVADPTDPNYNLLHGQPDGVGSDTDATGLSGTWQDSIGPGVDTDLFMNSGSLSFGDLATSGNHVAADSNLNSDIMSRELTTDAQTGVSGTSDLWFSFTANKLQGTAWGAEREGIVLGSGVVDSAQINGISPTNFHGFGVGWDSGWTAYGWDGTNQVAGANKLTVARDGTDTRLLVGEISYGTGTGGADVFTLYEHLLNGGSIDGSALSQITSIEVDADQSLLDTLNVTRQVNTAFDEIRFATTSDEALGLTGIPEPASLALLGLGLLGGFLRRPRRK